MLMNSYLQIDLQMLKQNVGQIRREIGTETKLIPVLKGNAYGLGAVRIAESLNRMGGVEAFAVSHVAEGVELRRAGFRQQILVMSLPLEFQLEEAIRHDLILTLGSFHQFPQLRELSRQTGKRIPVSLKLDIGLHRIGFLPEEMEELIVAMEEAKGYLKLMGTFSHFSSRMGDRMKEEGDQFRSCIGQLRNAGIDPGLCHVSSSASIEQSKDELFDAVRIGRRLMLDSPNAKNGPIKEIASFRAFLTDIREREAGETLAYEGIVNLREKTRIGILSVGYGDGLDPALAAARAPVLVNGQRAVLLACCMDQSIIDLRDIPCQAGDEVTLFGHDRNGDFLSAQEVMALIGAEGCDLTARLTDRVARVYIGE